MADGKAVSRPERNAPVLSYQPITHPVVARVLRQYLRLRDHGVRANQVGTIGATGKRGASAEANWCGTVAAKLARDPYRIPMEPVESLPTAPWPLHVECLLDRGKGRQGLRGRMPDLVARKVSWYLLNRCEPVNLAVLYEEVAGLAHGAEVAYYHTEILNRRTKGEVAEVLASISAERAAWREVKAFIVGHAHYWRSMDYLADQFGRCWAEDGDFLKEW